MYNLSLATEHILYALELGYKATEGGEILSPNGRTLSKFKKTGRITPYYMVNVPGIYRERFKIFVHRIAAYSWFGDKVFLSDIQVRHLNGNSLDNRKINLAIGSAKENAEDKRNCKAAILIA